MSKKLQQISVPLISVFLGILLGAIVMWIFGYDAIWGYEELFKTAFGTLRSLGEISRAMGPLILIALGFAVASRAGFFNVGLPGQAIKNKFAESVLDGTVAPPTVCDNCLKHCSHKFCIIRALSRAQQGDVETGLVFSGNNMRKVDRIMPVKDIFAQLKQQVAEID